MKNSQNKQQSAAEKPKLINSLLMLLVITFLLGLCIASLVIADIQAGVLQGVPETVYGLMISLFLFGPPFIVFGLITLGRAKRLKKDNQNIGRTIRIAGLITAIILVVSGVYSFSMSKAGDSRIDRGAQERQRAALNDNETITAEYATELLDTCKLKALYYGDTVKSESIKSEFSKQNDGIVLVKIDGLPYNIQIAERTKAQLLPIAENADKNCPNFSINGK